MEWKPLELSKQDKAFLEHMEQVQRDIASMFGVPSAVLGVHKPCTQEEYNAALASILKEMYGKATHA